MNSLETLILAIITLAGINAILFRKYYMKDFTEVPYLPPQPDSTDTPPYFPSITESTPSEPPAPPQGLLDDFCLAIRDFEGKPGDRNYKNNNPGNCRYNSGGYLPKYGVVSHDKDGFAIFKDMATGMLYLKNMIRGMIERHPNQTIEEFMWVYAPPEDNNPTKQYAQFIGKRLGVDSTSFLMKNIV